MKTKEKETVALLKSKNCSDLADSILKTLYQSNENTKPMITEELLQLDILEKSGDGLPKSG